MFFALLLLPTCLMLLLLAPPPLLEDKKGIYEMALSRHSALQQKSVSSALDKN